MQNITLPHRDTALAEAKEALRPTVHGNGHDLSDDESEQLSAVYDVYDNGLGRPQAVLEATSLGGALEQLIHDAYGQVQENRRLSDLRSRLKQAAVRCPYCGIGGPTELDHHLPRSKYKSLAVYSRNLVPTCHECNNKKRTAANAAVAEQFVHAYFDPLPNERFLQAQIATVDGALIFSFHIVQTANLTNELFQRLEMQFERLALTRRYKDEINVFLNGHAVGLDMAYGADQSSDRAQQYLLKNAARATTDHHLNDWRVAVFHALAENYEFCSGGFKIALGQKTEVLLADAVA